MHEGTRHRSGHVRIRDASCLPVIDGVDPFLENSRRQYSRRQFRGTHDPFDSDLGFSILLATYNEDEAQPASAVSDDR